MSFLVFCLFYSCGNKSKKIEELKNVDRLLILDFERQQDSQSFNIKGYTDHSIKKLSLDIADVAKRISNIKVQSLEYSDQQKVEKLFKPQALATGKYKSYSDGRVEITLVFLDYKDKSILSRSQVSGNLHNIKKLKVDLSDAIIEAFGRKVNKKKQNTVVAGTTNNQAQIAYSLGVVSFFKYDETGLKNAIKYFKQAIKLDQNYAQAYARLAITYDFYGDFLEYAGKSPDKIYDNICPNAKKALKLSPKLSTAYRAMANCLNISKKQNNEIMNKLNTAIKLDPLDGENYFARADLHEDNKDIVNALKDYKTASNLSPMNHVIYLSWGFLLANQKNYKEAIKKYKKVIEINPNYPYTYILWGLLLADQGNYKEAIKKIKKAIDINSNDIIAYSIWGLLLFEQGNYKEAIKKSKKAIDINPNYADAYDIWGGALEAMGKPKKAKKKFKKAKQLRGK
jgi:tetratricopeptide (TPR) repeat protein